MCKFVVLFVPFNRLSLVFGLSFTISLYANRSSGGQCMRLRYSKKNNLKHKMKNTCKVNLFCLATTDLSCRMDSAQLSFLFSRTLPSSNPRNGKDDDDDDQPTTDNGIRMHANTPFHKSIRSYIKKSAHNLLFLITMSQTIWCVQLKAV